ncbi:pyruvate dehydrogenase (acetyl-transferring) E1 component subunit alpha [Fluviispira multicolorata]|uniref:Pyruvate dehydrogenase E1 component subunit alpha n=1 Tax=Fluviispira multicolorata TaxID=2654512 RepID=A0A833JEQ1_9BACT|nr:pyruvate dehydrogenase (acetyl-transferring) E1 component subunit alpha [Fluviispira multicolorata]KAB8032014.1 pyruvate dehydrogenase (acetyl-transferring) E1 component subunit alpha [Fluviispira multicolorata]
MTQKLSNQLLVAFYKEMLLGRRLEERVGQLYVQQKFSGFCHLYIGQEAVSTGCLNAIRKGQDYVITGYRDHVAPVVLGMEPGVMMAELLGKVTGCARGKGGSMHMFSEKFRFMGGHGIVGGQVPLATGAAWKIKYNKEDLVALCFLGDAASNQGQFHEALNMAAIWDLPCIFIIENNKYGMGTAISRTCSLTTLADRAKAYNMRQAVVDGRNVVNTYTQMKEIVDETRKTSKPILVEIQTYRFRGHSVSDPGNYRTKEEVEKERARDCLVLLKDIMLNQKAAKEDDFEKFEEEIADKVEAAVAFAEDSPEPELDELYKHVLV